MAILQVECNIRFYGLNQKSQPVNVILILMHRYKNRCRPMQQMSSLIFSAPLQRLMLGLRSWQGSNSVKKNISSMIGQLPILMTTVPSEHIVPSKLHFSEFFNLEPKTVL